MHELGGWTVSNVRYTGGFRINGTSNPDDYRDGNSNAITSVVRNSAGLFTVTLSDALAGMLPLKPFLTASLQEAVAPTAFHKAFVVRDSWSLAARTFQIQVVKVAADGGDGGTDPDVTAIDPADNDLIVFELSGSVTTAGSD